MATTKTTKTPGTIPTRDEIRAKARELREAREVQHEDHAPALRAKMLAPVSVTETEAVSVTTVAALSSVDAQALTSTNTPALTSTMTPALTIETEALTPKEPSMNTDLTPTTPDALAEQIAEVEGMMDTIERHDAERSDLMTKRREIEEKLRAELAAVGEKLRTVEQARREVVAELVRDYGDEVLGNTLTEAKAQGVIDEIMAEVRRAAGEDADFLLAKIKIEEFMPTVDGGAELPAATMERMKKLIDADCTLDDGTDTGEVVRELREYVQERASKVGAIWSSAIVAAMNSAIVETGHATPTRKSASGSGTKSKAKNPRQYVPGAVTAIHIPGYVDSKGLGVEAKVYVAADGKRKVTLGGRGIPAYVARIGHHSQAAATVELERLAQQWAKDAGYLTAK